LLERLISVNSVPGRLLGYTVAPPPSSRPVALLPGTCFHVQASSTHGTLPTYEHRDRRSRTCNGAMPEHATIERGTQGCDGIAPLCIYTQEYASSDAMRGRWRELNRGFPLLHHPSTNFGGAGEMATCHFKVSSYPNTLIVFSFGKKPQGHTSKSSTSYHRPDKVSA
jgi:hypothetical protein